ncbi:MAG: TonB family protein [Emcibacter sp.]|nr:TonB family protein [Emcibacter sp.]
MSSLCAAQEYDRDFTNLIGRYSTPPIIRKNISEVFSKVEKLARNDIDRAFFLLAELEEQKLGFDEETKLYQLRGMLYSQQSDYVNSVKFYEESLKRKSVYFSFNQDILYILGKQSYLLKDYGKAIKYFNTILILNKKISAHIYFMLGESYFQTGHNNLAREYLRHAKHSLSKDKALRDRIKQSLKKATQRIRTIKNNDDGSLKIVSPAKLTHWPLLKVAPIYPREALRDNLEGFVILIFDISRKGYPVNIRVKKSSNPLFDTSAINSAKRYKYLLSEKIHKKIFAENIVTKISFELR